MIPVWGQDYVIVGVTMMHSAADGRDLNLRTSLRLLGIAREHERELGILLGEGYEFIWNRNRYFIYSKTKQFK